MGGPTFGASLSRIVADRGYRGHNAPPDHKMKVYISGQKRASPRRSNAICAAVRRSSPSPATPRASRMGRNFLKGTHGDAANAVLAAAGNFRRLLGWLVAIWRVLLFAIAYDAQLDGLGDA